jgi:hypothetical protein
MRRSLRGLLVLLMTLAMAGLGSLAATDVAAQASGTIEVHGRICDQVPADGDWFTACHDSLAVGVQYDATNVDTLAVVSGTTDATGNVVLNVEAGTWQLSGPPGDFLAATFIYCSTGAGTAEVAQPIVIGDGTAVICDYYVVPEQQGPGDTGSIEVHARICDVAPADGDWFNNCHANASADTYFEAVETTSGGTVSGTTGADGNLVFTLDPGTWQLFGPPGEFVSATVIYCSHGAGTAEVAHPVALAAGDAVICDYYFVPEDLSGRTPTPVPTAVSTVAPTAVPGKPVTGLPSTGAGEPTGTNGPNGTAIILVVAGAGILLAGGGVAQTMRKR